MEISNEVETTIALIQKDLENFNKLFSKIDVTVEQMREVNVNINRLLSLHEQRLEELHKTDKFLEIQLEKNVNSFSQEMKDIHKHIRENNRDIVEKLKTSEESIKRDIRIIQDTIDRENKIFKDAVETENKKLIETLDKSNRRIDALEKWRYVVGGGFLVVIWALNKSSISLSLLQ